MRLTPGTGLWTVNGKTLEEYLPNKLHQQIAKEAFAETGLDGKFDVVARVKGGGMTGQAGALRLGVARSLNEIDEDVNRPLLKKAGLLTRDARIKERKKAGLKKARKAPQYSKRYRRTSSWAVCSVPTGFADSPIAELSAELALDLAFAAACVLARSAFADRRPTAVVARDTRASGEFLEAAVVAGLALPRASTSSASAWPRRRRRRSSRTRGMPTSA